MLKKVEYTTLQNRDEVIANNSDLILVEEQNITEGNFLIFSDLPLEKEVVYINVPEQEFTDLQVKLAASQEAIDFLLMGGM